MKKEEKRLVSFAATQAQYDALQEESRRTGNAVSVILRRLVDEQLVNRTDRKTDK